MWRVLGIFIVIPLLVLGCVSSSNFKAWDGADVYEGQGGAFETKNGIPIYSVGAPTRKFKIVGVIESTVASSGEMMAFYGDSWSFGALSKEAKQQGGDAVILISDENQLLGYSSNTSGSLHQRGNRYSGTAVTKSRANVAKKSSALVIKYID